MAIFSSDATEKKRIKGLKPLNLKPGRDPVDEEHLEPDANLDNGNEDDNLEVRGLHAMIGDPYLSDKMKKKVIGLKPNSGTSDEKKLNHLKAPK